MQTVSGSTISFGGGTPKTVKTIAKDVPADDGDDTAVQQVQIPDVTSEDHIYGDVNAPVTIVEYSDLECPFCKRFHQTLLDIVDTNGDGTEDWKEDLSTGIFETIDTPTSTTPDSETYIPPTTFTGKFSEAFFKDYMDGKMNGADFSDPTAFVGEAVDAIDANTQNKKHTRLELTVVSDTSDSIHAYGNDVARILMAHSTENENEAVILQKALTANDPTLLEKLAPIQKVYQDYITGSLAISVPQSFGGVHIDLLNAYESILADISAMQIAFNDPLLTLARMRGYQTHAKELYTAMQSIAKNLNAANETYTSEEPGSLFYLFES